MARAIVYRQWPRNPKYWAGDDGTIIGPSGRVLKPTVREDGYFQVKPYWRSRGCNKSTKVHLIVAEAWHGPRPPGLEVAHGNGVRADNRPANLRWATHHDNSVDTILHGTMTRGERSGRARLTEADVLAIRSRWADGGVSMAALAKRFNVHRVTIYHVIRGRRWAHVATGVDCVPVPPARGSASPRALLTEEKVRSIRKDAADGVALNILAERFGVSKSAIKAVVSRQNWKHI